MSMSIIKPNPFEQYINIMNQFQSIKNLPSFINYTVLQPNDMIQISNITIESVDILSDLSTHYIKKINDMSISVSTNEKLQKMFDIHNELLNLIYKFNSLSSIISERYIEINANNLNQETINYIFFDIINRYKMIIYQIFDCIKKLNVYATIVKDKLN